MRKTIAIIIQIIILTAAYFTMTPDILKDNTWVFGLIGDVEVVKGNTDWIMLTAGILSVFNIWVWWPRTQKVINTSETVKTAEDTKSAEAKTDPVVPKMD